MSEVLKIDKNGQWSLDKAQIIDMKSRKTSCELAKCEELLDQMIEILEKAVKPGQLTAHYAGFHNGMHHYGIHQDGKKIGTVNGSNLHDSGHNELFDADVVHSEPGHEHLHEHMINVARVAHRKKDKGHIVPSQGNA
jgi:hypothetical protein